MKNELTLLPEKTIINKIFVIRGEKVMIDSDLAELYGVETRRLNEQVKRNINRFPEDFMFQLTDEEFENLISQFATSSWGGRRKLPYVFTEQGVAMLSSVLNSNRAIQVNIRIIRVFTKMRNLLSSHKEILRKLEQIEKKDMEQDKKISLIFSYLKQLEKSKKEELEFQKRRKIGFKQRES